MDLLRGDVRAIYRKYFLAAFGSALISCVYGVVDMAMVGQYQGPDGTAALSVVAPVWNVIYSLGLLTGIGGSVLLSESAAAARRGRRRSRSFPRTSARIRARASAPCSGWRWCRARRSPFSGRR